MVANRGTNLDSQVQGESCLAAGLMRRVKWRSGADEVLVGANNLGNRFGWRRELIDVIQGVLSGEEAGRTKRIC